MPRLLYIGSGNPWKGGAGYLVRQNLFLGALRQVAHLHVALFDCPTKPDEVQDFTQLTSPKKTKSSRLKTLVADYVDPLPRMMRGYDLAEPRKQIQSLNPGDFDAVFSYRIDFGHFAGVLDHPRLILDIDDPEHIRSIRRLQSMKVKIDSRTQKDLEKLKKFERVAVAGAKLAFVCQENDRRGWEAPPEVVPNCVQVSANPARLATRSIVLFVGNCAGGTSSPNVDAVLFFLSDIWPKILQAVPDAKFHLVGAASDTVRLAIASVPGAKLCGFVENLADVYAESSLSIAPIRFGTGTRIKILEAFGYAVPVVSTVQGAEGIDAVPGKQIELAEQAADFADRIIELLKDPTRAEAIGQAGYALAQLKYDSIAQQQLLIARFNHFLHA